MTSRAIRYSVIIPTYKNWDALSRVLPAVIAQADAAGDVEVIVVDSSDDGTQAHLRATFPGVTVIRPTQRFLPGPARNLGAASAAGDILIFLDGDCRPGESWLAGFRTAESALELGIVCGAVDLNEPCDLSQFMEYVIWKLPENSTVPRGQYDFVITENMMIRRGDFAKTGGFGSSDSANDAEMDAARRKAGLGVTFEPEARVFHIHPRGWRFHIRKLHRIGYETFELVRSLESYRVGKWMRWLFPVVFVARWIRITTRVIRYRSEWLGRYVLIQPMLWIGLTAYQLGLWCRFFIMLNARD